jgi:hypothetical protein
VFGCIGNFSFHRLDIYDTVDVAYCWSVSLRCSVFYSLTVDNSFHLKLIVEVPDPGCLSWIRILISYPSRIPDPGVKNRISDPDPQQWYPPPPTLTPPPTQPIRLFILVGFRIRLFTPMRSRSDF